MKKIYKTVVGWLYISFLSVQALSLASAFIIKNEFANNLLPFFHFWNELGKIIFENWLPFSILFILIYVGGILTSQIKAEKDTSNHIYNFILLCINLIICNNIYDNVEFHAKFVFLKHNIWGVLGFLFSIVIVLLIGHALKKTKLARMNYTSIDTDRTKNNNNFAINMNSNGVFNNKDDEERFMKRFPITYIWNNYKYYRSLKKHVKHEKLAEYYTEKTKAKNDAKIKILKDKYDKKVKKHTTNHSHSKNIQNELNDLKDPTSDKGKNKKENIFGLFTACTIIIADITFVILFVIDVKDGFNNSILEKILDAILAFINLGSNFFDKVQNPLLNWLILFGTAFLLAIIIVLINYLIYFIIRIMRYFVINLNEDNKFIKNYSLMLKTFFFKIVDDIMQLLMFIPDFLDAIEDILFDIDIDEAVKEKFGDINVQSSVSPQQDENDSESEEE